MKSKACATEPRDTVEANGYLTSAEQPIRSGSLASPTVGVVVLVLLILLAIATVIVLAWIGPVVSGDSTNAVLALQFTDSPPIPYAILTPAPQNLDTLVVCCD